MTLVDHRHAVAPDHSNAPPSSSSRLSGYIDDDHEPRNRGRPNFSSNRNPSSNNDNSRYRVNGREVRKLDSRKPDKPQSFTPFDDNDNEDKGTKTRVSKYLRIKLRMLMGFLLGDEFDTKCSINATWFMGDFAADLRLVFENVMLYNPRTDDVLPIQAKLAKNKRVNERVGNVANARVFDLANERVVNVNSVVNDVVNDVNRVNAFSAMDELDGSSWDDIQTPDRTKKAKTSGFSVASKQTHSTASNAVNAGIPPVVHLPVRMSSRTSSPMQVTEPVKPANTNTMTRTEDSELPVGRLVWLNDEGLPALGRHIRAVKAIVKDFDRVLEVRRLDFDAKILPPVKILLFVQCMEEICQSIDVSLNGKIFPVKVYEDRSPVFNLLSPSSDVEDEYSFEEEFVGPSIDIIGDGEGCPNDHDSNLRDIEESPIQSRSPEKSVPHGASPQSYNNLSPLASEPPPPPIGPHPAESSMSEEVVQPTPDVVVDRPNSLDVNSPNSTKSNHDLNMNLGLGTDVSDDDKELEDLFGSFERIS
ncbi:hypothetical protein Tco_0564805 [Tanacetum coccineum]